jgi:cell division protein FtsL
MNKGTWLIYLPIVGLVVLVLVLYFPQLTGYSGHISILSDLTFMDKTTLLLTFALTSFAAIEGFSTFNHAQTLAKRHQIDDARNELEKAYGPLYTLLNKIAKAENTAFWLDFEERRRINEIIATYPFMFTLQIIELWQEKIRNLATTFESSDLKSAKYEFNLDVYLELRNLINEEYNRRVKNYRDLLEK